MPARVSEDENTAAMVIYQANMANALKQAVELLKGNALEQTAGVERMVGQFSEQLTGALGVQFQKLGNTLKNSVEVQSDTVVESLADLAGYIKDFEVRGLGGTDFRPVFDYVVQLITEGKLSDLRGLIYFTDGLGIYPDAPPPFDTAFVFIENEGQPRLVPPWAMKVVLDEDQVRALRE